MGLDLSVLSPVEQVQGSQCEVSKISFLYISLTLDQATAGACVLAAKSLSIRNLRISSSSLPPASLKT